MTDPYLTGLTLFVLATYLGVVLIGRIPPTLHTPLMSAANAVSGITVVGAVIVAGLDRGWISHVLGFLAVVLGMMNVAGGYVVTNRMLQMFRKDETTTP